MARTALRHRAAVEALELRGDERVLEVGCGHGVATRLLVDALPRGQVTAIDRSEKMIAALRSSIGMPRNLTAIAQSFEAFDWDGSRFDAFLAINVNLGLRLGEDWPTEVLRVVGPGGRIVLAFEGPPGSRDDDVATEAANRLLALGCDASSQPITEDRAHVTLVLAKVPT